MTGALRLVLGDQLSRGISALRDLDPARDTVVMAEVEAEATYVRHHPKKIAFVLSAMRHFAAALENAGVAVRYVRLDDDANTGSLRGEIDRAVADLAPARVVLTAPGEWRLWTEMRTWPDAFPGRSVEIRDDDRFFTTPRDFRAWVEGRKQVRMAHFYRRMRQRTGYLMTADNRPVGGQYSYDPDNREPIPGDVAAPPRHSVAPDAVTRGVLDLVGTRFAHHFGTLDGFDFAVTHANAEAALEHFIAHALPRFGIYQDAMRLGDPLLFHSRLGVYLNAGLLDPAHVCRRAEQAWACGHAPINAVEGFIRQILGWREFVRGIYWWRMPAYRAANALDAHRPLPEMFWTGETDMACVRDVVRQTRAEAYAHHIQRLMVTGNLALLAGVHPDAVNEWYMVVYADAYEWVELPNVQGMALYADGGVLATKPYAASGAYINRMSNYCRTCRYNPKKQLTADACPLNALYWDFIARNRSVLAGNRRMAFPLQTLDRMDGGKVRDLRAAAGRFLASLTYAEPGAW